MLGYFEIKKYLLDTKSQKICKTISINIKRYQDIQFLDDQMSFLIIF